MTIDERLEALTQTVELLAHESVAMQKRHDELRSSVDELRGSANDLRGGLKELAGFVTEIAEGTARLLHVAEIHEQRLDRLEGGRD